MNRKTCSQFKVKHWDSSNKEGEYVVLIIFFIGRTVVKRKNNQTIFLEQHIVELERKYGITFKIINLKSLENNHPKSEENQYIAHNLTLTMITSTISLPATALALPLSEENEEITTITDNQKNKKNWTRKGQHLIYVRIRIYHRYSKVLQKHKQKESTIKANPQRLLLSSLETKKIQWQNWTWASQIHWRTQHSQGRDKASN